MKSNNSDKYLKGIFITLGIISFALIAFLIILVIFLNKPSKENKLNSFDETEKSEAFVSSYSVPADEIKDNTASTTTNIKNSEEEVPVTENTEIIDNDSIPAYADEDISIYNISKDDYFQLSLAEYKQLIASVTTIDECDLFIEKFGYAADIVSLRERLVREEGSETTDADAQICIDKFNSMVSELKSLKEQNYRVLNGTIDTNSFQNSFISFVLRFEIYSDSFMADYAAYISNLSLDERMSSHFFYCSYPYVPFIGADYCLYDNIFCESNEILYINGEKIVKINIWSGWGGGSESVAYFKDQGEGDWRIYFTEKILPEGKDYTKPEYKNMTP